MKSVVLECDGPRCSAKVVITGDDKRVAANWRSIRNLGDAGRQYANDMHFCNFTCMRDYIVEKDCTNKNR